MHGFLYGLAESSVIFASAAALSVSGVIFVDDTTPYHASLSNIFLYVFMHYSFTRLSFLVFVLFLVL